MSDPEMRHRPTGSSDATGAGRSSSSLTGSIESFAFVTTDGGGLVASWNRGAEILFGVPVDDAWGRPLPALLGGLGAPDEVADLLHVVEAGGTGLLVSRWTLPDGRTQWIEVALERPGGPGADGMVLIARDVTEAHRREEDVRRSSAVFEGILAIASEGVVCVDAAQRITFFNQGAEQIFGYRSDEVLGEPLDLLIPDNLRDRHDRHLHGFSAGRVQARQMGERGEISGRRRDGSVFPAEASISRLQLGDATIFTAVLRDVSERREAEQALARQTDELARSNAELEQFAYVASHDLQEPLRMVASYTQLLARRYGDRLDEDAAEFIGFAVDGVTRMQALINDLLAYSRVGRRDTTLDPVDLSAVLDRVLITLGPAIEEAGATVTRDPLPAVLGDALQLSQLLQNLIANALKFRGADPPRVHVGAVESDEEWEVRVADNGIGIDPEFVDRIFDIFQRLHSRGEYPGTGIGLAICKKIIERHGGRIWVDSRAGEGATFHFTLPRMASA
jgi:PAS domain S-box-containing protein